MKKIFILIGSITTAFLTIFWINRLILKYHKKHLINDFKNVTPPETDNDTNDDIYIDIGLENE